MIQYLIDRCNAKCNEGYVTVLNWIQSVYPQLNVILVEPVPSE